MAEEIKKTSLKDVIVLQLIIVVYTFSTVFGKMASGNEFMSGGWILYIVLDILTLAVYAILWQQALRRFDLHVAYANRSFAIVWGMIWSVVIFGGGITVFNIIGSAIIIGGTVLVNSDAE